MKLRKEYVILGILIVVLSAYVLLRKSDHSRYKLPVLPSVKTADITRIQIDKPQETISLYRKSGNWVVGENAYPADDVQVKQITDVIGGLTLTTLISESKNYQRYELGPDNKIAVKAWNRDKLVREFDIGKTAPSYRHVFVKMAGDYRVYQGRDNFRSKFEKTLDELRDKTVLSYDKDRIKRLQLEKETTSFLFTRETLQTNADKGTENQTGAELSKSPVWKNEEGKAVQDKKLKKLVDDLARLKCRQFIYDRAKADFKEPVYAITLAGEESYSLRIFERMTKGASEYPAVSSQNDYPFLLPKWQVDRIMLKPEDIQPLEAEESKSPAEAEAKEKKD